jgi:SAM-dependent methyltransferase
MTVDNFDEGLGTVYERLVMNDIFDRLMRTYSIKNVLEVPMYGMTGLHGINSVQFVKNGCNLTIVDNDAQRLEEAERLWGLLGVRDRVNLVCVEDFSRLPFEDNSFDLAWNFAALWHLKDAPPLVEEMVRVSSSLILISVQNKTQPGYYLRKYLIDRDVFSKVWVKWLKLGETKRVFEGKGVKIEEQGVFDVPPFPDIAMPIGKLLEKLKLRKKANREVQNSDENPAKKRWKWDVMGYYMGDDPELRDRIGKYMLIEHSRIPSPVKGLWAHHRYVLGTKETSEVKRACVVSDERAP